ncbi:MAG: hypothetical protein HYX94_11560 [Chloroflexi bacterium]|nr:hypothetical protein [Chloroflexota bacterium]
MHNHEDPQTVSGKASGQADTVAGRGKKPWRRPTITVIGVQRTALGGPNPRVDATSAYS